jgi:hypothetical protein
LDISALTHIRQIAGSFEAMIALLTGLATANRVHREQEVIGSQRLTAQQR